jgi:hypothetical protein
MCRGRNFTAPFIWPEDQENLVTDLIFVYQSFLFSLLLFSRANPISNVAFDKLSIDENLSDEKSYCKAGLASTYLWPVTLHEVQKRTPESECRHHPVIRKDHGTELFT